MLSTKLQLFWFQVAKEKNMKYPANHDPIHDQVS